MRKPRPYPKKQYRRRSSVSTLRWKLRRGGKVVGGAVMLGFFAIAAISGGENGSIHSASSQRSSGGQLIDQVTRVRDGDTIVVGLVPIRIANLDCAERGTKAGDRATRRVKELVSGQTLTCRLEGRRSYDREVGLCALPDGRDLGEVMIAQGACGRWR